MSGFEYPDNLWPLQSLRDLKAEVVLDLKTCDPTNLIIAVFWYDADGQQIGSARLRAPEGTITFAVTVLTEEVMP